MASISSVGNRLKLNLSSSRLSFHHAIMVDYLQHLQRRVNFEKRVLFISFGRNGSLETRKES